MNRRSMLKAVFALPLFPCFSWLPWRKDGSKELIRACCSGNVFNRNFLIQETVVFEDGWHISNCHFDIAEGCMLDMSKGNNLFFCNNVVRGHGPVTFRQV